MKTVPVTGSLSDTSSVEAFPRLKSTVLRARRLEAAVRKAPLIDPGRVVKAKVLRTLGRLEPDPEKIADAMLRILRDVLRPR